MTKPLDLEQFEGHTEGPWYHQHGGMAPHFVTSGEDVESDEVQIVCGSVDCIDSIENSKLIAAAPSLLAEVKALREENERLIETLKWIVDTKIHTWTSSEDGIRQMQEQARQALGDTHEFCVKCFRFRK